MCMGCVRIQQQTPQDQLQQQQQQQCDMGLVVAAVRVLQGTHGLKGTGA